MESLFKTHRPTNKVFELNAEFIKQTPATNTSNRTLLKSENIHSNWTYREFLQNNAINIMRYETGNVPPVYTNNDYVNSSINNNSDIKRSYMERRNITSKIVCAEIRV